VASVVSDSYRFQKVRSFSKKAAVLGGATSGALAGVLMAITAMITTQVIGDGFLLPMKLIAATFYGTQAVDGGPLVIVTGLALHIITSVVFGVAFALMTRISLFATGAFFAISTALGVVLWASMTYFVLPLVDPLMFKYAAGTPWFVGHIAFGAALGSTPYFGRHFQT
jgi:hypothetical protein